MLYGQAVVFDDIHGDDRLVEIGVGAEAVQLCKLGCVNTHFGCRSRSLLESAIFFKCDILYGHAVESGQIGSGQSEDLFLHVGFCQPAVVRGP